MTITHSPRPMAPTAPAAAIAAPVARTSGHTGAPTIMRRIAVAWELDPKTGTVTANGDYAGRVIESLPGKLYYFQSVEDAARRDSWGMFGAADTAAEAGAVRAVLTAYHRP